MSLPKAFVCFLGKQDLNSSNEEQMLQNCGFATGHIAWNDLLGQPNAWTQLLQVLDDQNIAAWVIVGNYEDFTPQIISQVSMLTLGMTRKDLPSIAFIIKDMTKDESNLSLPYILKHAKVFYKNQPFAPKIMSQNLIKHSLPEFDFRCKAHLGSLMGQWLEIGPKEQPWNGFMCGAIGGEIIAFGVGEKGCIPKTSSLHFPQSGIKGDWGQHEFSACAAQNIIDTSMSCYLRIDNNPTVIFKVENQNMEYTSEEETCWLNLATE